MLINAETARYLYEITKAIETGKLTGPFTTVCPECGVNQDGTSHYVADEDAHMVVALTSDTIAVVIGCEGYWVINPALVGIDSPNWSDGNGAIPA